MTSGRPLLRGQAPTSNEPRVNDRIRKSPVRLIDFDGAQVGIVTLEEAKARAQERGLDLVEVGATSDPPVVKIIDWGKAKFDSEKKARESRKKNQIIDVKEVKFRPTIGGNDFQIKLHQATRFLEKGKKVKVTVFFRFRQLRRPELGQQILDKVAESTKDVAIIETRSKLEGRSMMMVLSPHGGVHRSSSEDSRPDSAPSAPAPAAATAPATAAPAPVAESTPTPAPVAESTPTPAPVAEPTPAPAPEPTPHAAPAAAKEE
jgi:translation initiation factor IF-3